MEFKDPDYAVLNGKMLLQIPTSGLGGTGCFYGNMQVQIGERLTDSTGEWEVAGRPFTTAGGKNAHVRLQRVNQPGVTEIRTWGAHEKVSVKRGSTEEDKR